MGKKNLRTGSLNTAAAEAGKSLQKI